MIGNVGYHPKDKPVIPLQMVLHEKPGPDGTIWKRNVRIVASGHKQEKDVNFTETFTTTAKITSICSILTIGANHNWDIHQVDIVGVYLHANVKEEVFMELLPGVCTTQIGEGEGVQAVKSIIWFEAGRLSIVPDNVKGL
jgi:hypothetical protein